MRHETTPLPMIRTADPVRARAASNAAVTPFAVNILEPGLYLRVQELPNGPQPLPLSSGFSAARAYRALGIYNPSETSDAYFVLSNDRDEIWWICNRHLRTHALLPRSLEFHLPIPLPVRARQLSPC